MTPIIRSPPGSMQQYKFHSFRAAAHFRLTLPDGVVDNRGTKGRMTNEVGVVDSNGLRHGVLENREIVDPHAAIINDIDFAITIASGRGHCSNAFD
jgi:hypothetical protein